MATTAQKIVALATALEQANNRRNSHFLTFGGVTKTLSEWATVLGINRTTLSYRLKMGWSIEQAFTQPVMSFTQDGASDVKQILKASADKSDAEGGTRSSRPSLIKLAQSAYRSMLAKN